MLFNDYLTDVHYSLLQKESYLRNERQKVELGVKKLSKSSKDVNVKTDLIDKVENRKGKESVYYSFERLIFDPENTGPIEDRLDSLIEIADRFSPERMSKYKVHTLEMALDRINHTNIIEKPKRFSLFSKVYSKIDSYLRRKK